MTTTLVCRKYCVRISAPTLTILTEAFRGFSQSLYEFAGIFLRIGQCSARSVQRRGMRHDGKFYKEFYVFITAMYSFEPHSREAKFCGVPSCVLDKPEYAAGESKLLNTELCHDSFLPNPFEFTVRQSYNPVLYSLVR
jgi:hypothetical protein